MPSATVAIQRQEEPPIYIPAGFERCHLCDGRRFVVIAPNDMVGILDSNGYRKLPTIPGKIEECGACDGRGFHEEYPPLPPGYVSDWLD